MANRKIEQQLEQLNLLRAAGVSDAAMKELKKALEDRSNIIVAKAAAIVLEWQAIPLSGAVEEAFCRLFVKASESDPQCAGKNELAGCLKELGSTESTLFLRGLKHRQWENTWGGKTDTAVLLRSTCALALVQCTDLPRHEILLNLVDAVTDCKAEVRLDAIRALEQMGGKDVSLLLRLKARSGDKEARVTGQALESLLGLEGPASIPFVRIFVESADAETSEEAALALGASRLPAAIAELQALYRQPGAVKNSSVLLRAISASRLDQAFDFLLQQIRTAPAESAQDVLWALQLHRDSSEIVSRIARAVKERSDLHPLFCQIYDQTR